jgi:hypothetical protein
MAVRKDVTAMKSHEKPSHGAFCTPPKAEKGALRRYTDQDQLQAQGKCPTGKRRANPDAIQRSDLPECDKDGK